MVVIPCISLKDMNVPEPTIFRYAKNHVPLRSCNYIFNRTLVNGSSINL